MVNSTPVGHLATVSNLKASSGKVAKIGNSATKNNKNTAVGGTHA